MKGDLQVVSARWAPVADRRRWSKRITALKRKLSRDKQEQLVLIERLSRQERRERRAGEYVPDVTTARHWC